MEIWEDRDDICVSKVTVLFTIWVMQVKVVNTNVYTLQGLIMLSSHCGLVESARTWDGTGCEFLAVSDIYPYD